MLKILSCTALLFATSFGFAAERFSGQGHLSAANAQTTTNQRFSLGAALQAPPALAKSSANGRFSVIANLAAPKSVLAACTPLTDAIFKNGFEN